MLWVIVVVCHALSSFVALPLWLAFVCEGDSFFRYEDFEQEGRGAPGGPGRPRKGPGEPRGGPGGSGPRAQWAQRYLRLSDNCCCH